MNIGLGIHEIRPIQANPRPLGDDGRAPTDGRVPANVCHGPRNTNRHRIEPQTDGNADAHTRGSRRTAATTNRSLAQTQRRREESGRHGHAQEAQDVGATRTTGRRNNCDGKNDGEERHRGHRGNEDAGRGYG